MNDWKQWIGRGEEREDIITDAVLKHWAATFDNSDCCGRHRLFDRHAAAA